MDVGRVLDGLPRYAFLLIWAVLLWHCFGVSVQGGEPPKRLRLSPDKRTLRVGEQTLLTVEFLDRKYRPVVNDRKRVIEFTLHVARREQKASGEVNPPRIEVAPGAKRATTTFTARRPGKVTIAAVSKGLSSGRTLVIIVPQARRGQPLLHLPAVHAQSEAKVQIFPEASQRVPANGISRATVWVTLDRPLGAGERLLIRIKTLPSSIVSYEDQEQTGLVDIVLDEEGSAGSEEIHIRSQTPGTVRVTAQVLTSGSSGQVDETEVIVEFQSPKPAKIFFFEEEITIPSHQREVPLVVGVADQDGVPIDQLAQTINVHLSSPTDPDVVTFQPQSLSLSPAQSVGHPMVRLERLPTGAQITLLARNTEGNLAVGEMVLTLESPIDGVVVSGPILLIRGEQEYSFDVHLVDKDGKHLAADWDRKIVLTTNNGEVIQKEIVIAKNDEHGVFTYKTPETVGEATITAESRGLNPDGYSVNVLTETSLLILAAAIGGILGGLIRSYSSGVKYILPLIKHQKIEEIGLLGAGLFSSVIGVALFLGVKFGVIQTVSMMDVGGAFYAGTRRFAFFFGVLGGFGGTYVLKRMLSYVFPGPKVEVS